MTEQRTFREEALRTCKEQEERDVTFNTRDGRSFLMGWMGSLILAAVGILLASSFSVPVTTEVLIVPAHRDGGSFVWVIAETLAGSLSREGMQVKVLLGSSDIAGKVVQVVGTHLNSTAVERETRPEASIDKYCTTPHALILIRLDSSYSPSCLNMSSANGRLVLAQEPLFWGWVRHFKIIDRAARWR